MGCFSHLCFSCCFFMFLAGGFGFLDERWHSLLSSRFAWFWYAMGNDPSSADVDHMWKTYYHFFFLLGYIVFFFGATFVILAKLHF